jgi:hypothetical protein
MKKYISIFLFGALMLFGGVQADKHKITTVSQSGILEDKQLLSFMQEIKTTVGEHDWSKFIRLCSKEHYRI